MVSDTVCHLTGAADLYIRLQPEKQRRKRRLDGGPLPAVNLKLLRFTVDSDMQYQFVLRQYPGNFSEPGLREEMAIITIRSDRPQRTILVESI